MRTQIINKINFLIISVHCSSEERSIAKNLRKVKKSLREITKTLERSVNFVQNALKWEIKTAETRCRPYKTCTATDYHIVLISKKEPFKSSRAISVEIGNVISTPTVCISKILL